MVEAKKAQTAIAAVAPQEIAAPAASPESAETAEQPRKLDETIPGGYYIVNGIAVNCEGKPIEENKEV